jgi:endonuclease/exonuclease/phosphatase family metal-dependent hydrolase
MRDRNGRTLARVAAVLACLTVACGSSPSSPSASAAAGLRPPVTLRIMTFNIQHGIDGSGRYNLQRTVDAIARAQPDIVGLQEVTRNHPFYACDDQPQRLADGLRASTGQSWTVAYQQEWFTADRSCQGGGRGDGPETEGLVLMARRAVSSATSIGLPDSRLGLEVGVLEAYGLPIIVTHLTSGASAGGTRAQQIDRLIGWTRGFGEPRILMGDFNVSSQGAELQPIVGAYHDAWSDAAQMGRAVGAGLTKGGARIDYLFYVPSPSLALQSAEVVDTTAGGVQASDHQPVVATFTVR